MGCDNGMSRNREGYGEMEGEGYETRILIRQWADRT